MHCIEDTHRWKNTSRFIRLQQRQQIISTIRNYLHEHEFLEVETPLLVKGTCPDLNIESIRTDKGYLITSTEYQIKRLIAGGLSKVFTLTKNFRANDCGRYHSEEFTMLEWARAHESLHEIEEDTIRFIRKAFKHLYPDQHCVEFNGQSIDFMNSPWQCISVREAFHSYLGMDNLKDFSLDALLASAKKAEISIPPQFCQDKYLMMSYLFDLLQKHLGKTVPTFLQEWPAYLTTSAPISQKDPHIAERSELYIGGIEIADGFPFLRDSQLQQKLFDEELELRKKAGRPSVNIDCKYIKSLKALPSGAGMALGIDRLVMVLTQSSSLADVQAFNWEEL